MTLMHLRSPKQTVSSWSCEMQNLHSVQAACVCLLLWIVLGAVVDSAGVSVFTRPCAPLHEITTVGQMCATSVTLCPPLSLARCCLSSAPYLPLASHFLPTSLSLPPSLTNSLFPYPFPPSLPPSLPPSFSPSPTCSHPSLSSEKKKICRTFRLSCWIYCGGVFPKSSHLVDML